MCVRLCARASVRARVCVYVCVGGGGACVCLCVRASVRARARARVCVCVKNKFSPLPGGKQHQHGPSTGLALARVSHSQTLSHDMPAPPRGDNNKRVE